MTSINQEPEHETKNKKKGKVRSILIGIVLIAIVLSVGVWWFIQKSRYITSDDAYIDAYQVTVSSQIPGRIIRLHIHEGDTVKKGMLLAELDSSDYVARLNEARVNLGQAELGIRLAEVKVKQAAINYRRASQQLKDNIIPEAEFQNISSGYDMAKVELSLAQEKIKVIASGIEVLQTTLSHTRIYAPMDGVAAKRWVLEGDVVSPGVGIFTVLGKGKSWVSLMIPENELRHIHIGDTADVTVDAYPSVTFKGVCYQIGNSTASRFSLIQPNNASGNFTKVTQRIPLKLTVFETGNPQKEKVALLPGMSVTIRIGIK